MTGINKKLGEITAEADTKFLLDSNAFVETSDYRSILESDDRVIVVGRRGTGKSAIFFKLKKLWESTKKARVLCIAPEDHEIIGIKNLLKNLENNFIQTRAASKLLWRYILYIESLCCYSSYYKTGNHFSHMPVAQTHVANWNKLSGSILSKIRKHTKNLAIEINESTIGDLADALNITELEHALLELNNNKPLNFNVLVDRLDEAYEADELGVSIVAGILVATIEFNKKINNSKCIILLRDNIHRSIEKLDPDYSRNIEGQVIRLHWDPRQLLNLVTTRLRINFELTIENDIKVWDRCTANELKGMDGFKKCLQHTLYRPRDLLSLLNEAFHHAAKSDRVTIIPQDIEETARDISVHRLEDLKKEYKQIFPSIGIIVDAFSNNRTQHSYTSTIEIIEKILCSSSTYPHFISHELALLEADGLIKALYRVGFIGVYDKISRSHVYCHDGRNPDKEFSSEDSLLIHPCYWMALNLTSAQLREGEAEEINDEYEITVSSSNSTIRNERIGSKISLYGTIPEGHEGQNQFESWCFDVIKIIFAGHLSNIELHPNKNSVQRRDIVGTNTANSPTWKRIRDDYGVRQVVFEVKNYRDIGREELKQLLSYLTGPRGNFGTLGFIITRDESDDLKNGPELDWVREIYNSHNILAIRISGKTLTRLLSKLRNPNKHDAIDEQISKRIDTYERNYLQTKSTPSLTTRTRTGKPQK